MRFLTSVLLVLVLIAVLCSCSTKHITPDPNVAPTITSAIYDTVARQLTVVVVDTNGDDVTVTVTQPAGLAADTLITTVVGGAGSAVFTWTAVVPATGGQGNTTVTATDGIAGTPASQVVQITVLPVSALQVTGISATDLADGTARLTVSVAHTDNLAVSVAVSTPTGMEIDQPMVVLPTGNGNAVVTFTAINPTVGATGSATITAFDTMSRTLSVVQAIVIAPVPVPTGPAIGDIAWVDHNDGSGTLSVPVANAPAADAAITVTVPTGTTVDNATKNVAGGNGTAEFVFTETAPGAGATGAVTVTASEGGDDDTASVNIALAHRSLTTPPVALPDTLYVYPKLSAAAVGEAVDVYVVSGETAQFLSFASSMGVTVETGGAYVPASFNIGTPGGSRLETDGYWALMGPPAPANGAYLDLGDSLLPGTATDIGGGFHRYTFAVVPQGVFAPPATWPAAGVMLCNFKMTFSAPGTYHLGFQLNDGTFDQTYYGDWNGTYFWGTLDNSFTITIN